MVQASLRKVPYEGDEISYLLEQKPVKNLNLRMYLSLLVFQCLPKKWMHL